MNVHLLIVFMGFMMSAKKGIVCVSGKHSLMPLTVCRYLHLSITRLSACMVVYLLVWTILITSGISHDQSMYQIKVFFVTCCGLTLVVVLEVGETMIGVSLTLLELTK